jgi:hypothetical protein
LKDSIATLWMTVVLLLPAAAPATLGADDPSSARNMLVRLLSAIKADDAAAAKGCYAGMTPTVAGAMDAFIKDRVSLRMLINTLEQRFPDQVAGLQKSELAPFTDQSLDEDIARWRAGTEKPLRDGSVLVKTTTGSSAIVRKTDTGWRVDFASMMEGRIPRDDVNAVRAFLGQENEQRALCDDILAKLKGGRYHSLLEATHAFDMQLDAIQLAHRPTPGGDSTQPSAERPNSVVSWSVAGSRVAIRADDGSIKAWDFETGSVVANFPGHFQPHGKGGSVACGPGAALFGLVDPNDSKSLRVIDAAGKPLTMFSDFERTDLLPNGMLQRIIGFIPNGAALITAQNNDDCIARFDLQAKRVTNVLELSKQLADPQFSAVVALRDASAFLHFYGREAIGYDFQGNVRWRTTLPNLTAPLANAPYARLRPRAGTLVFERPQIEDAPMVTDSTAFWLAKDEHPTRIDVRTGALSAMIFAGPMREVVAVDADHGFIVTRDPDDDSYWLWNALGQKHVVGDLSGRQRIAFSPDGAYVLARTDPNAISPGPQGELELDNPIQVFHIDAGVCEKSAELR